MPASPETKTASVSNEPARPRLALRIGVTGARSIDGRRIDELGEKVRDVLDLARGHMLELAKEKAIADVYAHGVRDEPVPVLRLLSPLAAGADRLAAEVALDLGYALFVPMPFPRAEYEKDFTGTNKAEHPEAPELSAAEDLAQFRVLLARAGDAWLALDGDHGPEKNRAYESVGRFVVRHSDVLIAIWDGEPAHGRGGTEEIVRYAAAAGVPVWWIHATRACDPIWIADVHDLHHPQLSAVATAATLRAYIDEQIRPSAPAPCQSHGLLRKLARLGQRKHVSPAADYFAERPLPRLWIWRAYSLLMRVASGRNPPWTPPRRPERALPAYWFDLYAPADARAGDYAARYRSSYVWIFLLATLALVFGTLAITFHGVEWAVPLVAGAELTMLLFVLGFVLGALRRDWHERSIEYRLLAELCRKQQVLAPLGRAVSLGAVRRIGAADRHLWVAWLFAAYDRAAPLPRGDLAAALPEILRNGLLEGLIEEQSQYHRDRGEMATNAGRFFERWGERSFVAVFAFVLLKLAATCRHWSPCWALAFGVGATVLPAISAAFVGIRSYAEFELLAEQSDHMKHELDRARKWVEKFERVGLRQPLASQDLGAEAQAVAMLMLQDLEGWARLFGGKAIGTQ